MQKRVIIAGGGPVGLIVGLILGRGGIKVTLFDKGDILHQEPRAATIHPATLDILDELGVYQNIEPLGLICPVVNYYDQHDLLASLDHGLLKDEVAHPWVLQCEQDKLSRVLFKMAEDVPDFTIRTECTVTGCSQTADGVTVTVTAADGSEEQHQADYLVGSDGARSTIRKIAGVQFEGFTYPERFLIIGTPYDFREVGYAYRNYISDPEEWYNLFAITWKGPPGVFRLVVPAQLDEPLEGDMFLETAQRKLQRFHPRDVPYEIAICDAYVVSQRVAATFRINRILLAGDSAHLNSPIGAMGMNSGIHDAVNLGRNMVRVLDGQEDEGALDRYVRQRRHVATEHVQAATITNKRNMEQRDPAQRRDYNERMRRTAADPALAKKFLMRTSLVDSLRDAASIS